MALSVALATLLSNSGAHPEAFGYHPVDWITSAADENGEAEWSTSDMIIGKGWRPTTYDEELVRTLFGEPKKVAPDVTGWAFAYDDAPDFGVMLVPVGRGVVVPGLWDRGMVDIDHWGEGGRMIARSSSAWLNALAEFQRDVLHEPMK